MSMAYLAQPEQQQQLEWLDGGTLAMLLDGKATDGQLMIGPTQFPPLRGVDPNPGNLRLPTLSTKNSSPGGISSLKRCGVRLNRRGVQVDYDGHGA